MKAIILAGGVGSRISREVNKPKSLLDIGDGMPLLRYTVEMLQRKGIEVSIVLGYKKEMFYEVLDGLNVNFYFNPFYRVTNSIASLWFAKEAINDDDDYISPLRRTEHRTAAPHALTIDEVIEKITNIIKGAN